MGTLLSHYNPEKSKSLELVGSPPSQVITNFRKLKELNLLANDVIWDMMAQTDIDPFFFIRIISASKEKLNLNKEEQKFEHSIVFTKGVEKKSHMFEMTLHVNIFNNDLQVFELKDDKYILKTEVSSATLFESLKEVTVGDERLKIFLEKIQKLIY